MNRSKPIVQKKSRAQAMVEFALALPLLLMLLYGVLETGRLTFIYASTVTAARQAVRYGSATGMGPNGVPYFRDCVGIQAAAQNVGFINDFQNIVINYDSGPNTTNKGLCPTYLNPINGDRIRVSVEAQWQPIVPLVPLDPFVIRSESARTILASVSIQVTAPVEVVPPGSGGSGIATLISVTTSSPTYSAVDQVIYFTYNMQNTGTGPLASPSIVDSAVPVNCPAGPILAGSTFTCAGQRTITLADLDEGRIVSTAYPLGWVDNTKTTTVTAIQNAALNLEKSATPNAASRVGRVLTYSFVLTNTGNVTLRSPYTVADDQIPTVNCPSSPGTIKPGESITCNGTDQVEEIDIERGSIINQATASAVFDKKGANGTITPIITTSNVDTFTVLTPPIILNVSAPASVAAPGSVVYTFNIINDTDYPASSVSLNAGGITLTTPCPNTVAPNSTVSCMGTSTFTQTDIDLGISRTSTFTVSANMNARDVTSNPVSVTVAVFQTRQLTATATATPSTFPMNAGDTIQYKYSLTNSGNVTLSAPFAVSNSKTTITCPDQSDFPPGAAARECTGTYILTANDIDTGFVKVTGPATALFNKSGTPETLTSSIITLATPVFNGPRFKILINGTLAPSSSLPTIINYTYTITNTGSVLLTKPYTITTSLPNDTVNCALAAASLDVGDSTTCMGEFIVNTTGIVTNTITGASTTESPAAYNLPQSVTTNVNICSNDTVKLVYSGASSSSVTWTITNNSGEPLTLTRFIIRWDPSNRLRRVTINNTDPPLYLQNPGDSTGTKAFTGSWAIANGGSMTITVLFSTTTSVFDFTIEFAQAICGSTVFSNP